MSRWRFGCGKKITVYVPKGWDYRPIKVECGSTSHWGGVNQCEHCSQTKAQPRVPEYGDVEHDYGGDG